MSKLSFEGFGPGGATKRSRWAWTMAFRSKSARSNNSLIITKSNFWRGQLPGRVLHAQVDDVAVSSPRRCSRERSSSQLGGRMKMEMALEIWT